MIRPQSLDPARTFPVIGFDSILMSLAVLFLGARRTGDQYVRAPLSCPKYFHIYQDGSLGPTIFGPVGDIRTLDPLFAGLVHDHR